MAKSRNRGAAKLATEPRLGIFWLIDGTLLMDSAPLSECEPYGDHLNFPGSHLVVWERWTRLGKVRGEVEYEEPARGRVIYDTRAEHFTLLADKCILDRVELIAQIKKELNLSRRSTSLARDSHYRCSKCLHGASEDD